MKLDARFYWDTARFFFSMVGGGAAGYYLAKGMNSAMTKAAEATQLKLATKLMETDNASEDIDLRV